MSQGSLDPKIRFIGQKVCSVARVQTDTHTDRHTHRQTDTKVNTKETMSWFQDFVSSIYHQGSVQYILDVIYDALACDFHIDKIVV